MAGTVCYSVIIKETVFPLKGCYNISVTFSVVSASTYSMYFLPSEQMARFSNMKRMSKMINVSESGTLDNLSFTNEKCFSYRIR